MTKRFSAPGRMDPQTILNPLKYSQWLISEMKRINERNKVGLPPFDMPDFEAMAGGDPEKKLLLHAAWLRFEPPFDRAGTHVPAPRVTRRRFPIMMTLLPEVVAWLDEKALSQGMSKSRIVEQIIRAMMDVQKEDRGEEVDRGQEHGDDGRVKVPPVVKRKKLVTLDEDDWAKIRRGDAVEKERDERDKKKREAELKKEREEVFERAAEDGLDPYDELDEVREKRLAREERERKAGKRRR